MSRSSRSSAAWRSRGAVREAAAAPPIRDHAPTRYRGSPQGTSPERRLQHPSGIPRGAPRSEEAWPVALEQESERGAIATSGGSHQLGICGNRTGEAQEVLHTTMMRAGPKKFDTTIRPNVSEWQLSGRARLLTVA
jgi:hypothetical protein